MPPLNPENRPVGTDIKCIAQRPAGDQWEFVSWAFDWRSYAQFGFLADVRNYSQSPVISEPRGRPDDLSAADDDRVHEDLSSSSWLSLDELEAFDYDQAFEDRREGGQTLPPGEGSMVTLREFLGEGFFDEIARLRSLGAARIVFGFGFAH